MTLSLKAQQIFTAILELLVFAKFRVKICSKRAKCRVKMCSMRFIAKCDFYTRVFLLVLPIFRSTITSPWTVRFML